MSITVFKPLFFVFSIVLLLAGCGLTQRVADGTSEAAKALFYKQIKTLHLDFTARSALNTDGKDNSNPSVSTMVRVYQLRDSKKAEQATYQNLLSNAESLLQEDLLAWKEVLVKPSESSVLNMDLDKEAKFVVVIGLFRTPDSQKNSWRLVIPREALDPDSARVVELSNNALQLLPNKKEIK